MLLAGAPVFVLPNPSGRNAHYTYSDMLEAFRGLKRFADNLPKTSAAKPPPSAIETGEDDRDDDEEDALSPCPAVRGLSRSAPDEKRGEGDRRRVHQRVHIARAAASRLIAT